MRRGFTLLELLVAATMGVILVFGIAFGFSVSLRNLDVGPAKAESHEARLDFEDRLTRLLRDAYVDPNGDSAEEFFLSDLRLESSVADDTLTFTTLSERPSAGYLGAEARLEDLNASFGPQAGLTEVTLSPVPFDETFGVDPGVYLRRQRPSDGDPEQGGFETLFTDRVVELSYEFFDGETWRQDWDTAETQRRLPSLVRVTYFFENEPDPRVLVVRLRHSDATPDDPVPDSTTQSEDTAPEEAQ